MNKKNVYSVSMVNQYIKNMFAGDYVLSHIYIKGEISNCKYHSSGHIYFTIKDRASQMLCVMFAGDRGGLSFRMEDGQEVIVGGRISVYERDGKYQVYAKEITLAGEGQLYEKFEQCKKKLESEGLFDATHKKAIPDYAKTIGIVTASTGAAIQDIQNIARRRNPYVQLILYPAKVQGDGAEQTIIKGIHELEKKKVDIIIIGRGGGSIEDLWAFNEEHLARTIYKCNTPIISAVGHETDVTISDFVSDLRAPTPSAAAELAVYDVMQVLRALEEEKEHLVYALGKRIAAERQRMSHVRTKLNYLSPEHQILQKKQYLIDTEERLILFMGKRLELKKHQFALLAEKLHVLSPLQKLRSGFAYVETADGIMTDSVNKVHKGDELGITLSDGTIRAKVIEVAKGKDL